MNEVESKADEFFERVFGDIFECRAMSLDTEGKFVLFEKYLKDAFIVGYELGVKDRNELERGFKEDVEG